MSKAIPMSDDLSPELRVGRAVADVLSGPDPDWAKVGQAAIKAYKATGELDQLRAVADAARDVLDELQSEGEISHERQDELVTQLAILDEGMPQEAPADPDPDWAKVGRAAIFTATGRANFLPDCPETPPEPSCFTCGRPGSRQHECAACRR